MAANVVVLKKNIAYVKIVIANAQNLNHVKMVVNVAVQKKNFVYVKNVIANVQKKLNKLINYLHY